MKRLFQHYEGVIQGLIGKRLKNLKCICDKTSKNVILIWLESDNSWFRIFIDGTYCGVEKYNIDESQNDAEVDDDLLIEYKKEVDGLTINNAIVKSWILPEITLIIELSNSTKLILNCNKNEICVLDFNK